MADTSIGVSDEVWEELHRRKERGDTFDDVLRELLGLDETAREKNKPDTAIETASRPREEATIPRQVPEDMPKKIDEEEARAAIEAAVSVIKKTGGATQREIVAEVMPEHDLDYDLPELETGERYRGGWWRSVVMPGLKLRTDVEKPPQGASEWTYIGKDNE